MTEGIGKSFKKNFLEMKKYLVWMSGFLVAERGILFMGRNYYENVQLLGYAIFGILIQTCVLGDISEERPNIVFILGDDQHWSDYGLMGYSYHSQYDLGDPMILYNIFSVQKGNGN